MSERRQSRLVPVANRARRVKLGTGGRLLTRFNRGGELRPRQSARYPHSSLYGVSGGGVVQDFVSDMIFGGPAAPAKYLNKLVQFSQRVPKALAALKGSGRRAGAIHHWAVPRLGGTGYIASGGAANPWIAHVKRVAMAQGLPYGEAMQVARATYRGGRGAH